MNTYDKVSMKPAKCPKRLLNAIYGKSKEVIYFDTDQVAPDQLKEIIEDDEDLTEIINEDDSDNDDEDDELEACE